MNHAPFDELKAKVAEVALIMRFAAAPITITSGQQLGFKNSHLRSNVKTIGTRLWLTRSLENFLNITDPSI